MWTTLFLLHLFNITFVFMEAVMSDIKQGKNSQCANVAHDNNGSLRGEKFLHVCFIFVCLFVFYRFEVSKTIIYNWCWKCPLEGVPMQSV